jgi:predicted amidohydrolase
MPEPLDIACFPFPLTGDVRANAAAIREAIDAASKAQARILVTPECALTGYPIHDRVDMDELDLEAVASLEDDLAECASMRGMVLVLGTVSAYQGGLSNDALLCGAISRETRYRKRLLFPMEEDHFLPGNQPVTFDIDGWRIAVTICYEVRASAIWCDLMSRGVDAIVHLAHMAGHDPDHPTKQRLLPELYAARAAEMVAPLILCNCADRDRWIDSGVWDARGILQNMQGQGMFTTRVQSREAFDPWYTQNYQRLMGSLRLMDSCGEEV